MVTEPNQGSLNKNIIFKLFKTNPEIDNSETLQNDNQLMNAVEKSVSFVNNNYKPKSTILELNIVSVIKNQKEYQENGQNTIGQFYHNNGVNPNVFIA